MSDLELVNKALDLLRENNIGITLKAGIQPLDLLDFEIFEALGLKESESKQFWMDFIYLLGLNKYEEKDGEWQFLDYTSQLWYLDAEFDGPVTYGDCFEKLKEMAGNKYAFTSIDNIDDSEDDGYEEGEEDGPYGFSFVFDGQRYEHRFAYEHDWLDEHFFEVAFGHIERVYGKEEATRFFAYGCQQGLLIGYLPKDEQHSLAELMAPTRLEYFTTDSKGKRFVGVLSGKVAKPQVRRVVPNYPGYTNAQLVEELDRINEDLDLGHDDFLVLKSKAIEKELARRDIGSGESFWDRLKGLFR